MRKTLWIISVLLLISAIGAQRAHADSFTYSFVGAGALSGTNFTVVDTSGPALFGSNLASFLASPSDLILSGIDEGPITLISIQTTTDMFIGSNITFGHATILTFFNPSVVGTYQTDAGILTVAAPEPSSVVLMLIGIALVLLLRKRNSRGHQLAT